MSLLSGLKKAYDSWEGEVSRTFDSQQSTPVSRRERPSEGVVATEEDSPAIERGSGREGGGEESWGDWEEQDGGGRSSNKAARKGLMQLSSGQDKDAPSDPPPHPQPSSESVVASPVASSTPAKTAGKRSMSRVSVGKSLLFHYKLAQKHFYLFYKLDNLPRAELVKYVKRQAQLLQKSKSRCDELAKECSQLKMNSTNQHSADSEGLMEELQVVRSERDKAVADQRTLQQSISSLEQEKQDLTEEKMCLEKKVKQLESSEEDWRCKVEVAATQLSAQQQEHKEVCGRLETQLAAAEDWRCKVEVAATRLLAQQQEHKEVCGRLETQLAAAEERAVSLSERLRGEEERVGELEREIRELRECVGRWEGEVETVRGEAGEAREEVERVKEETERETKTLQDEVNQLKIELSEMTERERETNEGATVELERKIEDLELQLESVVRERDDLRRSGETAEAERERVCSELAAAQEAVGERETEVEDLQRRLEESIRRVAELEDCVSLRSRTEEGEGEEGIQQAADKMTVEEKEREIGQMKAELERLGREKEELEEKCEEAMEAVEREKLGSQQSLTKETESHREETKKLKAYIMKMKKELAETRDKMAATNSSSDNEKAELQRQLDEMKATLGAEQQSVEEGQCKTKDAEESVKTLRAQLEAAVSEREGLQANLTAASEELSLIRSELSTAQSDLATLQTQVGGARRATEEAEKGAESLREELARERESHSNTKQKLAAAVKGAKVSSVMNLELADYQRSLQSLEERLAGTQGELEGAREEGRRQQDRMDSMRKELDLKTQQVIAVEERLSKTKSLWMKTKKELDTARKTEEELQVAMATLTAQLEGGKQEAEQRKVEMAALTAKLQSMQQASDSSVGVLQKTVRSLEHKLSAAQNELTSSQLALSQCQQDYNNYKIRVHSVLKQKNSGPSPAEISTEIRQKFETEILQLKAELQESKSQLSSALVELEEVSEEHHQLSSRHQQLLQDSQTHLSATRKQLEEAESRHAREGREQAELIGQLRQEVVEVTETFRRQLQGLQEDHQRVVGSLSGELEAARNSLSRLQQEADARVLARASSNQQELSSGSAHSHRQIVTSQEPRAAIVPTEQRGSGEGMDQSELESFPQTPLSREDSQLSFERLLSRADSSEPSLPPSSSLARSSKPSMDPQMGGELAKARKIIRDLTELLRESEEAGLRLGEQSKLLKEEIRRLERNREREEGVSNMEYLKNVVLKFLHNEDSEEQEALIPVITQLLRLSPHEAHFLQDTIKGTQVDLPDASSSLSSPSTHTKAGLAGYIHRWTGY